MAPGGVWLSEGGGSGTPHYVVNPDHIARLQLAGYQPIADPRITEETHDDRSGRAASTARTTNKGSTGRVDATH